MTIVTRELPINFLMVALVCHLTKERVGYGTFCEMPEMECKFGKTDFSFINFVGSILGVIAESLANMFMVAMEIGKN